MVHRLVVTSSDVVNAVGNLGPQPAILGIYLLAAIGG
jgi:hypothetical protein